MTPIFRYILVKYLIGILIGIYALFCIAMYSFQEKLIFNPEKISEGYNYNIGSEVEISLDKDVSMNALLVKAGKQKSRTAILYLHGNRGSIRFGTYQIRQMKGLGYDILIPDYRGYGKTEGKPESDPQLLSDAKKAFDYLASIYGIENIIIVGYSLGTGMASYVASQVQPKHLVLIAPFVSLTTIKDQYLWFTPDFLLKYKLDTGKHLESVNCPVTILHGTNDRIVKFYHSEKLKSMFPNKINLIARDGTGHRQIIFDPAINKILARA